MPFIAVTYLPEERGSHMDVTDYRSFAINRTKDGGSLDAAPAHLCVRLSWNGVRIHQLCLLLTTHYLQLTTYNP